MVSCPSVKHLLNFVKLKEVLDHLFFTYNYRSIYNEQFIVVREVWFLLPNRSGILSSPASSAVETNSARIVTNS